MLTLPWKHFKCYKAQPFPAPYEKITTVPKVVKKKIPKGYGLCCLTIMFAVSMYKLMWFSPSTDSEVVTALGWGCVHVTELRRGQVVCLEDGGTLRLLSQVPGLCLLRDIYKAWIPWSNTDESICGGGAGCRVGCEGKGHMRSGSSTRLHTQTTPKHTVSEPTQLINKEMCKHCS